MRSDIETETETETEISSCVETDNERSSNHDRSSSYYNMGTGNRDEVHEELWHACAGPLAYVPKVGEIVFYFPQGHIEQVEAYINQDDDMEMPIYKLPSKILCKVVGVQLKVETHTDEVFAKVNLLPLPGTKQDEVNSNCKSSPMPQRDNPRFFVKNLTRSDTSTHGGCSLPKQPAEECLPSLDKSQDPPEQDLVTKDLHGNRWCFRHAFRGYPRRHLLARGWSDFLNTKNLVTGDACVFLRGRDGDVHIGVRRSTRPQKATSLLSAHGMRHGILANAFYAVSTGTMFAVYYRPWGCTSGFIVPYEQYNKAMANDCSIGRRVRMQFEENKCGEERLGGTVVSIEDIDPIRWPGSDWRCIEVKWDPTRAKCIRPERVSPWDIEPVDPDRKKQAVVATPRKRKRPHNFPSHWPSTFIMDGSHWTSVAPKSRRHSGVFQGQEKSDLPNYESNAQWTLPLVPCLPTPNQHVQLASQGQIHLGVHSACHQHPESTFLVGDGDKGENQGRSDHWPPACIAPGCDPVKSLSARDISPANSTCQAQKTSETKDDDEKTAAQTNHLSKCKVFGVIFKNDTLELPSPQVANFSVLSGPSVPPLSKSSDFAQVVINGAPLGRPTYLEQFEGCDDLIHGLDQMFNFGGTLIDGSSGWHVKCLDGHGDSVPIWDYTWQLRTLASVITDSEREVVSVVHQILVRPKEEEKGKQGPCSSDEDSS